MFGSGHQHHTVRQVLVERDFLKDLKDNDASDTFANRGSSRGTSKSISRCATTDSITGLQHQQRHRQRRMIHGSFNQPSASGTASNGVPTTRFWTHQQPPSGPVPHQQAASHATSGVGGYSAHSSGDQTNGLSADIRLISVKNALRMKTTAMNNRYLTNNINFLPPYSEIIPSLFLGDGNAATDPSMLNSMGVTHILNVAHGSMYGQVHTSQTYYSHMNIKFMGIAAQDSASFNLLPYFATSANFIDRAMRAGGIVLVHCKVGVSRSATIVLAYLMLKKNMSLEAAIRLVKSKRQICPNDNFLMQLIKLDNNIKQYTQQVQQSSPTYPHLRDLNLFNRFHH